MAKRLTNKTVAQVLGVGCGTAAFVARARIVQVLRSDRGSVGFFFRFKIQDSKIQSRIVSLEQRVAIAKVKDSGTPVRNPGRNMKDPGRKMRSPGSYCEVFGEAPRPDGRKSEESGEVIHRQLERCEIRGTGLEALVTVVVRDPVLPQQPVMAGQGFMDILDLAADARPAANL